METQNIKPLLDMTWAEIKKSKLERDLYNKIWKTDKELQYVFNGINFVSSFDWLGGLGFMHQSYGLFTARNDFYLMQDMLNQIEKISADIPIKTVLKLIVANLTASLIISKAIEKVFAKFKIIDNANTEWDGNIYFVSGSVLESSPISSNTTPLLYSVTLSFDNTADKSSNSTNIAVKLCNLWAINIPEALTIQDIIENYIKIEISMGIERGFTVEKPVSLNATIKDFPNKIKEVIKNLL